MESGEWGHDYEGKWRELVGAAVSRAAAKEPMVYPVGPGAWDL